MAQLVHFGLTNLTYILHSLIKWAQNENTLQIHRD